jgi:alkanesulfonate monooxygenase SsuD/methylene tetrahydromethanopterin reductase-like flavin-dependent oxidoreductase (luciferase family)
MQYGAHLPLIDFDGHGFAPGLLTSFARNARDLGFDALAANDHLVFQRPWLDGLIALASVAEASGDLRLATTAALPVVRGAAALAKAAAALDIVSGGRLTLGVGPGSSARDYELAGVPFEERWPRFDAAVRELRSYLSPAEPPPSPLSTPESLLPAAQSPSEFLTPAAQSPSELLPPAAQSPSELLPPAPLSFAEPLLPAPRSLPIWVASWGSAAGLRRVARLGDGWLASGYNATPAQVAAGRETLVSLGRPDLPCALATLWTFITEDGSTALARLADMLNRPIDQLVGKVLIGPAPACAATLRAYADAGVGHVFIWPLAEPERQLELFMQDVVPAVGG